MNKGDIDHATEEELERLVNEGYSARKLRGPYKRMYLALGMLMAVFHIYFLGYDSLPPWILYFAHVCFGLCIGFMIYPFSAKSNRARPSAADICLIALACVSCGYFIVTMEDVIFRVGVSPTFWDLVFSSCIIALVLEITRRTNGPVLPVIAGLFILYALFGNLLPYELGGHRGYRFPRLFSYLVGLDGLLSTPLAASAGYVYLLLLFSSFLASIGAGQFFIDVAMASAGARRGGPAKVAVLGSALFGTISGNSSANVVASGTFTIPMMRKVGYSARFAGAVEAVASTGGQMTPPILGAAAFIVAELTGTPYLDVALASVIPAVLYFFSIFYMVDLEAITRGLKGLPRDSLPETRRVVREKGHLILPIFVLMVALVGFNFTIVKACIWAIYGTFFCAFLRKATWISPGQVFEGFADGAKQAVGLISACATAGLVIGVLNLTGAGLKFAGAVIALSGGLVPVALILTMAASLVLGMGLPTAAAYLICAAVVAPALVRLGIEPFYAHMFIFYFACLSAITPPVALAAFTAGILARTNPMGVAVTAVRLGFIAFIVPFMFIYSPSLLWRGSLPVILGTLCTAMLGVVFLGSALQGVLYGEKSPPASRALYFCAALALIKPGMATDALGIGLFILGFLIQRMALKKQAVTAP